MQHLHPSFVRHNVKRKHLIAYGDAERLLLGWPVPAEVVDKELPEAEVLDVFEIEVSHVFSFCCPMK